MPQQPRLPFRGAVLSRDHGGTATCRGYCRFWVKRPAKLDERLLCAGDESWLPCPDYQACSVNPVPQPDRVRDPSKPLPNYSLRPKGRSGGPHAEDGGNLPDDAD
jgi:hypothetical protein